MRLFRHIFPLLSVILCFAATVFAGQFPHAKVDYSADSYTESNGMTVTSRVYHSMDKERIEMKAEGAKNIMILRMDKKVSWMVMPEQRMYMEMNLAEGKKKSGDLSNCQVTENTLGSEKINGMNTRKSKVAVSCPDGSNYDGLMWVTKEGILMRMESTAQADGKEMRFVSELKNLKIAKQDPSLFEVPGNYQKMNVGDIFSTINMQQRAAEEAAKKKEKQHSRRKDDGGRSFTASGRSYTAAGRSYTAAGRSYTAGGRSYTSSSSSRKPASPVDDSVDAVKKKIKGLFPW